MMLGVPDDVTLCSFDPCDKPIRYRGLCSGHAEQARLGKTLRPLRAKLPPGVRVECSFDGCDKGAASNGLCWGHDEQRQRGLPLMPLKSRRPSGTHSLRDELGRKMCASCEEWKDLACFNVRSEKADGYHYECKVCVQDRHRLRRLGVTPQRFKQLLAEQEGKCAICRKEPDDSRQMAIDHDHRCCPDRGKSCGKCVRGLLCSSCNMAIGAMGDDPDRLMAAVAYLLAGTFDERRLEGLNAA